jgi:hypothetical protein
MVLYAGSRVVLCLPRSLRSGVAGEAWLREDRCEG